MEGTPGAYSTDPLLTTSIMSAVVLCNIGIIYHLKSLEERGCEDIAGQLFKAWGLYEKSHLLLRESLVWGSATGNPTLDLLFMVVANNLGQVSFDLSCFDDSKHYYYILRDFCMSVVPTVYADLGTATFLNQERNKFLLNALLKSYPTMAAAAWRSHVLIARKRIATFQKRKQPTNQPTNCASWRTAAFAKLSQIPTSGIAIERVIRRS